ncbi:hypothetical protein [Zavarzinella formosa]|uniref:hypothetical protein n=1 Tax=Zavarzinella formosa TaxID=360055 RepID=UPI001EE64A1E|nr:hypothetical protein [Zavarzinella formosa]
MRALMCRIAALILGLIVSSPGRAETPATSFKFGCEVFAMADGPCVICFTLTNIGEKPVDLTGWSDEAILAELVDSPWDIKSRLTLGESDRVGTRDYQLQPQEAHRTIVCLHHDYQITTTPARIQIKAKFRKDHHSTDDLRAPVIVNFSGEITIKPVVNNATTKKELIARIAEHGRKLSLGRRLDFYRDCVLDTSIKEFLPLALETLRETDAWSSGLLVDWMTETLSREEFWRVFETDGVSAGSPHPSVWLERIAMIDLCPSHIKFIGSEQKKIVVNAHPVGEEQYRLMRASPNMIARLAAAYYFPKSHTNPELKALLAEAAKWKPPLTEDELKGGVKLLASNSFREREAAARRLRSFGERGVVPLTKLLDSISDVEALARLKAIIQQAKTSTPSSGDDHFITRLAVEAENRETRVAILTALAKNDPSAHITQLAEKGLRELTWFEESRAKRK